MIINHNLSAMNAHRQLGANQTAGAKSQEKLSSGLRINRAGDDAAGLAISEKMRAQVRGLDQASRNAQDGISLIQTAEGALTETHNILQRMRELATQSSNDTNTEVDRNEIQKELNQLTEEIDRIANSTEFNNQKLLNGEKEGLKPATDGSYSIQNNSKADIDLTVPAANDLTYTGTITITRNDKAATAPTNAGDEFTVTVPDGSTITLSDDASTISGVNGTGNTVDIAKLADMAVGESVTISFKKAEAAQTDLGDSLSFQIGANSGQNIKVGINDMRAEALSLRNADGNALDVTDGDKATSAITTINNAIETVSSERSKLGAVQNRLEHTISNLDNTSENLQAAESRVRDVDMAKEIMNFTKNNILSQASQAMLAQANQAPQSVLQLLG
ncbi:flagellar hook-associated protein FlgL [Alkalicoccobacillus plakortidis]|uniref:Flagellin n=1 Tax=Alkalicoccobacillus plakortidis TaxID=444060 RepID=A0ABT0XIY9_9BACI|nr:flagellar hook-associated protein FlgL [Alkalicoccobacillus plakortidis]MCM2675872.1 flagellar hook-associated protein FlgL [Alkalicoccobacillus plakortidis]